MSRFVLDLISRPVCWAYGYNGPRAFWWRGALGDRFYSLHARLCPDHRCEDCGVISLDEFSCYSLPGYCVECCHCPEHRQVA